MERETIWWLPMGLILATALNGLFHIVRVQIEVGTVTVGTASPLPSLSGLILAGVMAIGVALMAASQARWNCFVSPFGMLIVRLGRIVV